MTDKKALEILNREFSESYTSDQAVEKFIYLTNKSRGKHTTRYRLFMAYQNGTLANTLKRLDPTAFQCAKNDLNP